MKISDLSKKRMPDSPGVYFFLGKSRKILYIGKATSIRDRIRSYFSGDISDSRGPVIVKMLEEATGVKWQRTDSVLEALILESKLIRRHKPRYNTKEKDNKSFNHVVITDEDFPRVLVVREHELLNKGLNLKKVPIKYEFGPFPNGTSLKIALSILRKIFPFRDKRSEVKNNKVFYKQLGLTPDVTRSNARTEYQKSIRNIKMFFDGKKDRLIQTLEKEMKSYAKNERFELAQKKKQQIFALKHIQDVALVGRDSYQGKKIRIEAYDVAHTAGANVVGVMVVIESGMSNKSQYRKFNIKNNPGINDAQALQEILDRRFSHPEWTLPKVIVVDGGKAQKNAAERILRSFGLGIYIVAVVKDERHRPKKILGDKKIIAEMEKDILLANNEAHRFAINFHRKKRDSILGN